jgi:hypothetical protein
VDDGAKADADDAIDRPEDQHHPWAFRSREQLAQPEDDPALVLRQDLNRREHVEHDDHGDHE